MGQNEVKRPSEQPPRGDDDNQHFPRPQSLMEGVDFAWTEAERGNGKDHWSIRSMLLMGKGIPGKPIHVRFHLRRLAGLSGDPAADQDFPPLGTENLSLLKA